MVFSSEEDIEILDLDDNINSVSRVEKYKEIVENDEELMKKSDKKLDKNKNDKKSKNNKEKNKKVRNKKVFVSQLIFCSISLIFIIGCFIFYGGRLIKYYRVYNPKSNGDGSNVVLLSNGITSKSEIVYEDDGLYISSGNYIYKGEVSNNYIRFNNMLWRIVRINRDGTVEIILDDHINMLNWDNEHDNYIDSNIYEYLNNYFLESINKDMLTQIKICTDKFNDLKEVSCNNTFSKNFVSLLDVSNFLNSTVDGKSYLVKEGEIFWLSNQGEEKVWHTNGVNVSMSTGDSFYEVRPLISLKSTTILYNGDGTLENPYIIEEDKNEIRVGSYIKLGDDLWNVYNNSDQLYLSLSKVLDKQYHFGNTKDSYDPSIDKSLASYLNTTYLESLSYKDLLIDSKWFIGSFDGNYQSIKNDSINAKVGILNLMDLKFDSSISNYLLSTTNKDGLVYTYGDILKVGKKTVYRNIRPCISIAKDIKILSGKGTSEDPYMVEA